MKKIILILLFTSQSIAQTTLTSSINPLPGDIDAYAICDTTNVSQGNSGGGQTWNFSNLTRQDSSIVTFVASGTTPYASQFPTSNIASTADDSTFSYMTASLTNLLVNGYGGTGLVIPYSDPQLYMQYPFTFNNNFNDNFAASYTAFGTPTVRTGTTSVIGDAWGTINLPNGSFPNALRVKYIIITKDSSNPGTPFVITTTLTSYVWFVPEKKFPVFEIVYNDITLNGIPFGTNKVINYNSNSMPIGITSLSSEIPDNFILSQNYPNPFNPVTNLEFRIPASRQDGSKSGFVSLKIYNMLGEETATLVNANLIPGTYRYSFDASALTSGIYFYTLKVNEFSETKKMMLVK